MPNRIDAQGAVWAADDPRICRLRRYRKERTSLHRDEKILLSWNAWTIIALAQAGIVLPETRYLSAAMKAQRFIEESMTDKTEGCCSVLAAAPDSSTITPSTRWRCFHFTGQALTRNT